MKRARDPEALRRAMKARDLTFREMALLCECSTGTIQLVLAGQSVNPRIARRIARVLRGRLDALFADAESSSSQEDHQHKAVSA